MTVTGPLWRQIERTLREEIADGRYPTGARLPSEADLARRFGVNRHTVRRALGAMQDDGLVMARRGAGVFVTGTHLSYRLGPRTRFTQNLASEGRAGSRSILRLETLPGSARETEALGLNSGDPVHLLELIGMADQVPITHVRSVFPALLLPGFPQAVRESLSITRALDECGVADYRRTRTQLTAERAAGTTARHLQVPEGAPVLVAQGLNLTAAGDPVEWGRTTFAADRVELVVDEANFG